MKKTFSIILALALMLCLSVPAFAADYDQDAGSGQTDLTYTSPTPSPIYTVSIPSTLALAVGDTTLNFVVSAIANLPGGKSIEIKIDETSEADNAFKLRNNGAAVTTCAYTVKDASNANVAAAGTVVASFTANGTKGITINIAQSTVDGLTPSTAYAGYLVFGIGISS